MDSLPSVEDVQLHQLSSDANCLDIGHNETSLCQMLGEDGLGAEMLGGIGLHLECDDDLVYKVPVSPTLSQKNVRVRISFPSAKTTEDRAESPCWKCEQCNTQFKRETMLKDHMSRIHGVNNLYQCGVCQYSGNIHRHLYHHMRSVHNISISTVEKVQHDFSGVKKHFNGRKIKKTDQEIQVMESKLPVQSINKKDELNVCESCGKSFASSKYLKEHQKRLHNVNRRNYQCDICDKMFKKASWFRVHLQIHSGNLNNCCSICDKKFASIDSLKAHSKVHLLERNFICEYCSKSYKKKNGLREHYAKKHAHLGTINNR